MECFGEPKCIWQYQSNWRIRWNKYEGYVPFFTWWDYGVKLVEALEKLVEEYGLPQYPEDVTGYVIRGKTLREWLDDLKEIVDENSDLRKRYKNYGYGFFDFPSTMDCYYVYPIFHELIVNPEKVINKIREQD